MSSSPRRWQIGATILIAVLAAGSSLLGLFRSGHYNDAQVLVARYQVQDLIMLTYAIPVLLVGLWRAGRGSLRGRVVWLGALTFMAYMWVTYALQVAFNEFFLGYVALVGLSLYTLIGGIVETDVDAVHERLSGRLSKRLYVGVFLGIAVGLAGLWLSEIVPAILTGTTPGLIEQFGHQGIETYVIDLAVVVPALGITAAWLWWDRPWGYLCAGVMLVFAAVLAPNLTAITVIDVQTGVVMSPGMIIATVIPPAVGILFAAMFLRSLSSSEGVRTGS